MIYYSFIQEEVKDYSMDILAFYCDEISLKTILCQFIVCMQENVLLLTCTNHFLLPPWSKDQIQALRPAHECSYMLNNLAVSEQLNILEFFLLTIIVHYYYS